ncbi:unnamed protein product [Rhodiola kirilowii]
MISRKIDERNEKIVRGLLKLPPNRRCINCDALGPQYVCTNFWTFICTTCSGIHREFTHRVKSISMSKFTTQEVEALQNGGNQRARELYLKGWDFQRQKLPSSSNVDRIREFIKVVYVDKKYISGKVSDAPSADYQSPKNHEEHRRASSYHSYSQSPPYDHQYEERKYGKRAPVLTRKPGSEKSLHIGKVSSFVCSPTRMSEQANDNMYTNEGSISKYSLHSESSGGDPFRSENMSPSSYNNHGFSSPSAQDSMEWKTSTFMEENVGRDVNKRTQSSGSIGSFDRNSASCYSCNSNSQVLDVLEHNRSVVGHHNDMLPVSSMGKHSSNGSSCTDRFGDQVVTHPAASSSADFFQLPTTSPSTFDLSQASTFGTALATNPFQSSKTHAPSVDLFDDSDQDLLHVTNLEQASSELTMGKNEGWATFNTLDVSSSLRVPLKSDNVGKGNSFSMSPFSEKTHYEPHQCESISQTQVHNAAAGPYRPVPSPWSDAEHHQAFNGATIPQSWSAFEDPIEHTQWESIPPKVESQFSLSGPSPDANQYMNLVVTEGLKDGVNRASMSENGPPFYSLYQHTSLELYPQDQRSYTTKYKNPFDLPFDLDPGPNKEFLNIINSLGAALPSDPPSSASPDEFAEPWLSQHPVTTLSTSTVQATASLLYMAAQSQTSQLTDVSPHSHLASIGGNPFG